MPHLFAESAIALFSVIRDLTLRFYELHHNEPSQPRVSCSTHTTVDVDTRSVIHFLLDDIIFLKIK